MADGATAANGSLISLHDVHKVYHRDKLEIPVLAGINLEVKRGEFLALMGPSGSGKSTLLNLIGGIDRATRGEVRVAGESLGGLNPSKLAAWRARHVGFIFQLYNLIPVLTAYQNVELPLLLTRLSSADRKKRVHLALQLVGLDGRASHLPRQLSGGEEQRVAIARAIVADPTLLVADEPTGDLDAKNAEEILVLLQRLNREMGKTILMVTHDPHAAERAQKTLHLDKGVLKFVKFLRLILAHLLRSKRRTFLTVSSIAIALFLFCTLRTVMTSLDAGIRASDDTRLVVRHAASLVFPIPLAYKDRLEQVPGVQRVGWGNWFGGYYQDPKNQFTQFAVDPVSLFDVYPEVLLAADQRQAFIAERTSCIMGQALADKYGWKLGDVVPITGTIYPGDWRLTVRGIYRGSTPDMDENTIFFQWNYLNEVMPEPRKNWVGIYWIKVASPADAPGVSARIDALYENSPQPTKTETEKAFQAGFIQMMGNVSLLLTILGSAIVFAIMLVTINTMMMSARERTTEIAVLKTLGFADGLILRLVAAESMILSLAGGFIGCGLALVIFRKLNFTAGGMFPNFRVLPETLGMGLLLALVMGLLSGLAPAVQAARLQIAGALRKVA